MTSQTALLRVAIEGRDEKISRLRKSLRSKIRKIRRLRGQVDVLGRQYIEQHNQIAELRGDARDAPQALLDAEDDVAGHAELRGDAPQVPESDAGDAGELLDGNSRGLYALHKSPGRRGPPQHRQAEAQPHDVLIIRRLCYE